MSGWSSDDVGVTAVYVRVGGGGWELASATVPWSAYVGLSPGNNLVEAHAVDAAGNQSAVASVRVIYTPRDTSPPVISISAPHIDGMVVGSALLVGNGTAFDDGVGVTAVWVRLNGGAWQVAADTHGFGWLWIDWSINLSLVEGSNQIEVYAVDVDGNQSAPARRAVTYFPGNPLAITGITKVASDVSIGFQTLSGKAYRVLSSPTMQSGSWTVVSGHTGIPGDGTVVNRTLAGMGIPPPEGSRFFRVEEE